MRIKSIQNLIDRLRGKKKPKRKIKKIYSVPYIPPKSTYKNLICITGFGHSGSGTLLDYFSEFDNTTVLGYHDVNGSGFDEQPEYTTGEIDFIRFVGGLLDLEYAFIKNDHFHGNFDIKLFLRLSEVYYRKGSIYNDEYWRLTNDFVDKLVDYKLENPGGGNEYIYDFRCGWKKYKNISSAICTDNHNEKNYIYFLKKLSVPEYRKLAREYINSFLKTINSKEFLVLDQVISTSKADVDKKLEYMGDFKLLCVYRDPRDVYETGFLTDSKWIPREKEDFVKWYIDGVESYIKEAHPNKLVLRFEDFVLNYDENAEKINAFVGIEKSRQIKKQKFFNPEISKKNIGIWKTGEHREITEYIGEKLSEYCFDN